jgi:hypothetical protein
VTHEEQREHRRAVIARILELRTKVRRTTGRVPAAREVVDFLNGEGVRTNWGRPWTERALSRMLAREGTGGLQALFLRR